MVTSVNCYYTVFEPVSPIVVLNLKIFRLGLRGRTEADSVLIQMGGIKITLTEMSIIIIPARDSSYFRMCSTKLSTS